MIPKGLIEAGEAPVDAAVREFEEETGLMLPAARPAPRRRLRQAGGKTVLCWAAEADLDLAAFRPGQFEMEWPPRSGKRAAYPEIDRLAYFDDAEALTRILPSQAPLIAEVLASFSCGRLMRIATFNINNVNKRLRQPAGLAGGREAGRGLPAGAEGRGRAPSRSRPSRPPATARSGAASAAGTAWRSWRGARPRW